MWYPLSLEMKMIRPQFRLRIAGRYSRASRAPLSTFTSKNRSQSASVMSSNGLTSKIPKLFTRISTAGCRCARACATSATLKSPANPTTSPPVCAFIAVTAPSTAAGVLPETITLAPSRASDVAMALPMPAVDPLTSAIFSFNCRSIGTHPQGRFKSLQSSVDRHGVLLVNDPVLHHEAHALHQADIIDRIARNRNDIGDLARHNGAQFLVVPQQLRRAYGCRLNGEHRRHARRHHQFEFMRVLAVRIDRGIGAERNFHIRLVCAPRRGLDQRPDRRGLGSDLRRVVAGHLGLPHDEVAGDDRRHIPSATFHHEL